MPPSDRSDPSPPVAPHVCFRVGEREVITPSKHPADKCPDGLTFAWDEGDGWASIAGISPYTEFCEALGTLLGIRSESAEALTQAAYQIAQGRLYARVDPVGPSLGIPCCYVKHNHLPPDDED